MNKQIAKEILSAYRPNGADATDNNLGEALELCERDPEMKAWLVSELAFDARLAQALLQVRGPEAGKNALLATVAFNPPTARRGRTTFAASWWKLTAVAAALAVSATLWHNASRPASDPQAASLQASWLASVGGLAEAALPLDKTDNDLPALQAWLAEQGAPVTEAVPAGLQAGAQLEGCRAFDLGGGKKASLICYQLDGQFVHLFVFDKADWRLKPLPEKQWARENGWNLLAWSSEDKAIALATKADPDVIDRLISII